MTTRAALRKGWCPGARRPMESGDGLLLRVRPRAGTFTLAALLAIAQAAKEFGSGEIDLTNRGNLQLRGVSADGYPEALALLDAEGLIDEDVASEAVRNVIVDPLSGIDPARADVRSHAARLEDVLVASQVFQQLPGKFGFSFSGSPEPCIGGRAADVMISAAAPGSVAISLDGSTSAAAIVPTDGAVEAAIRVAAVFLELCLADPTIGRMKDAVARRGCAAIYAAAGLSAAQLSPEAGTLACPPPVGLLKSEGLVFAAGVGLPFGRLLAGELEALYGIGLCVGVKSARTSPQRALVFPVNGEGQARAVLSEAAYRGLIIEPGDARLKLDVCPGSPACRNASTETRRDAMHLVESLENAIAALPSLHISGCEKGCARRGVAAVTLVARNGRYDIVRGDGPTGPVAVAGVAPSALSAALAQLIDGRAR